jgi:hypothetical protein
MIPKTLSASASTVADACMRRYTAEYFQRSEAIQNTAANLGTTVHETLEEFVNTAIINKTRPNTVEFLLSLFTLFSIQNFGSTDYPDYADGTEMLKEWHSRTDFSDCKVISTETGSTRLVSAPSRL